LIAVAGSLDPDRRYRPPLRGEPAQAEAACREIGAELLRSGFDLLVFSTKPGYVEATVAAGYLAAARSGPSGRIVGRPARDQDFTVAVPPDAAVEVQVMRDTSGEWEVSYYRSLVGADGVVLIGGGQSTRIAGIMALSRDVPVVPVATFGGGAGQVWVNLDRERPDLPAEEIALLAAPWSAESAGALAKFLHRRIAQRAEERERALQRVRQRDRSATRGRVAAAGALVAALAAIPAAGGPGPAGARALALLLAAPMLAAVAGAIIRDSFGTAQHWSRAAVRGLGAGVTSVLLYIAAQLLTLPGLLDHLDARRLLFFVIPLGFGAGFTFDLVFDRLRAEPVLLPRAGDGGTG
jgi:hypothetical protein